MHKIIERRRLVPNIHLLRLYAPKVARKAEAGNFVIIKIDERGERIPLSVADWDTAAGEITIVFMTVGATTHRLARMEAGDEIEVCTGPLGRGMETDRYGTVAMTVGCFGIGASFPVARALKQAGNEVIVIMEARTTNLLYWEERYASVADEMIVTTFDGTKGTTGHAADRLTEIIDRGTIDRVIALGCTYMMIKSTEATRQKKIKTIVSLNPIMIDGTGMCGVCRCIVGGKTRFACIDGPAYDAHEVDWDGLVARRRSYLDEEVRALSEWECQTY